MNKYFLGVDPGVSGAFALIDENLKVWEMNEFKTFKYMFDRLFPYKDEIVYCVMEDVHLFPGQSLKGGTSFMKNAGGLLALAEVAGIKSEIIKPQNWQKVILGSIPKSKIRDLDAVEKMGTIPEIKALVSRLTKKNNAEHKKKIKAISIKKANERFRASLQPHQDGCADALNMALYALKYFMNQIA